MNLPSIREQIKVILSGIPGIGVVHDYNRLALEYSKMLALFKDADGRINTCMFAREKTLKRTILIGGAPQEKAHIFLFRKIMGLHDAEATAIIFDDHLTAIEEEFEKHEDLNGSCLTTIPDWGQLNGLAGIQIEVNTERNFGGVLCHYAEMRLCAIEFNT
jgi:hypothetical protein